MINTKRNKIKLSLIDDYIKIVAIENFYNTLNDFSNENFSTLICNIKQLDFELKTTYTKLIKKLKLNDLSFLILKKELSLNNSIFINEQKTQFSNLKSTIEKTSEELNQINNNLKEKMKLLKVSSL